MIETFAFLAMFTVQILTLSVLFPARLIRYVRVRDAEFPDSVFEKLYPGVDRTLASNRFWNRFRAAHTVIAVLGLVLLGWMLINMQLLGSAKAIMFPAFFFLLQVVPLLFLAFIGIKNASLLRPSMQERKRTAVLQRRGLFDFVSPPRVVVEVVIYLLFAAFMVYLMYFASSPIPKVIGYQMLGAVTLGFLLQAFWLYWRMYGKKVPLESDADRMRSTGVDARSSIYGTVFTVALITLIITLPRLGLQEWLPFTLSAFFVIVAFHMSSRLSAAMLQPRADSLGESPVA